MTQLRIRRVLPALVATAFSDAGIDLSRYRYEDRGDGALIVLPAEADPLPVLCVVVPALALAVTEHNSAHAADPAQRFALRMAVDWGTVHPDPRSFAGSAINDAARLVDAEPLRRVLRRTGAVLGVAVSTSVYDNYVRHGYDGIERSDCVESRVAVKDFRAKAWIRVPNVDTRTVRRAARVLSPVGVTVAAAAGLLTAVVAALLHGARPATCGSTCPTATVWPWWMTSGTRSRRSSWSARSRR